jgi:hypothetical protein
VADQVVGLVAGKGRVELGMSVAGFNLEAISPKAKHVGLFA